MLGLNPIFTTCATVVESNYSSRFIAQCRSKMFTRLVKGGTEYSDKNRPGAIVDGFSNHLTQGQSIGYQVVLCFHTIVLTAL